MTFKDRYEDAVRDLIARKKRGQKVTTAPPVEKDAGNVIDLMDALRRWLQLLFWSWNLRPHCSSSAK